MCGSAITSLRRDQAIGQHTARSTTGPRGYCWAETVFASAADPDYRLLLAMVEAGKRRLDEIKRFDMPGFKPREEYFREMKRFGLLPARADGACGFLDLIFGSGSERDMRAGVGQRLGAVRARQDPGQVDDADAVQRFDAHGWSGFYFPARTSPGPLSYYASARCRGQPECLATLRSTGSSNSL